MANKATSNRGFPASRRHARNVLFVFDKLVAQELFEVRAEALQAGNAVDDVAGEMEAIQIVEYGHIERSGGGSLFLVTADVEIVVIGAAIGEAVNERGITVVGKDDGLSIVNRESKSRSGRPWGCSVED